MNNVIYFQNYITYINQEVFIFVLTHYLIFDRFHQVDIYHERTVQGAGPGLYITKANVEMPGVKIRVESEL